MRDLSIIVTTTDNKNLHRVLNYIEKQSVLGIDYEVVIVQESDNLLTIDTKIPVNKMTITRQDKHNDYGATAKDVGISISNGEYVVFWDDDNLYYDHAIVSLYSTAQNFDIGVVKVEHNGAVIPTSKSIAPGLIDTMCVCVKKELAALGRWNDGGGRYSDYRWLIKIANHSKSINYSKVIIGRHL